MIASQGEIIFGDLGDVVPAQDGVYKFFVKIVNDLSVACLALPYILDTTAPRVISNTLDQDPMENDDTPRKSKTWNWSCMDRDPATCEYRYRVDSIPTTQATCVPHNFSYNNAYSKVATTATKTGGDGKYCVHIQARDRAGIESPVTSVYATLDNTAPTISGVTVPSKTYSGGDRIDITAIFSEPVTVTGTPRIPITLDGGDQSRTKYAGYYSGSGSAQLVFRYTVAQTDSDTNGIGMTGSIDLNSGSLMDIAENLPNFLTFTLPTNLSDVIVDGSQANVVISKTDVEVDENGGTEAYTVKLNKAPLSPVTVRVVSGDRNVATVSPSTLTFEVNNDNGRLWSTPQTVTITGVNDDIDNDVGENPQRTTNLTHTVTSRDEDYSGLAVSPLGVTSLDNDEIGSIQLSVNPDRVNEHDDTSRARQANNRQTVTVTARFQGSQSGGQPNGSVRLSDDVTLSVSVRAGTAQTTDFSPVPNFNITIPSGSSVGTEVFQLTVIDDEIDEVNETLEVRGSTVSGVSVNPASLIINDNDGTDAVIVGLENDDVPGKSKTWSWNCRNMSASPCKYRYRIDSTPTTQATCVAHTFSSNDTYSEIPATATKTGGDGKYCIHVQARDRADNESEVVSVYATFDNTAPTISGVTVPSKIYVGGDRIDVTATFSEPVTVTGTPRIPITLDGGDQSRTKYAGYYSGSDSEGIVFRYTVGQTDSDTNGIGMTESVDLNSGILKDRAGNSVNPLTFTLPTNLSGVIINGGQANVVISKTDVEVDENGGTEAYTVKLNKAPSSPVTVTVIVVSGDRNVATVSPSTLTFEVNNDNGRLWSTPQTVTITGVNDDIDNDVGNNPQQTTGLTHTVTSRDGDYNGLAVSSVGVTVLDDDDIGSIRLTLKKASQNTYSNSLSLDEHDPSSRLEEADNTESIEVQVEFQGSLSGGSSNPNVILGEDVTVGVSVKAETAQVADFTAVSDFNISIARQLRSGTGTFNLTLIDDGIDEIPETLVVDGAAVFARQGGTVPSGLHVSESRITINDNDGKGVEVVPSSLLVHEGSQETYTLRLQSEPTGPVVISVRSADSSVATVSPASLTFEVNNDNGRLWSIPQTVTVTGVSDNALTGRDRVTGITHTVSGGDYSGLSVSGVQVTVPDRENRLTITQAENILADNHDDYSIGGSCVLRGGMVSVQVDSLSSVNADCRDSSWSVTGFDTSGITVNGRVTITATQTVDSDTFTESVEVDRCVSSEDDSFPKWICSYSELNEINKKDSSERYYVLGVDIDARASWSEGEDGCEPYNGRVISGTNPCSGWELLDMSGGFDGRGHSIENLYIHSSRPYVGLFGQSRAGISNLHLREVRVHSTMAKSLVGAITGRNYGNIEGCSVTGVISSASNGITGGLAGDIQGDIQNSYVDVEVRAEPGGDTIAGGLAGLLRGGGRFVISSYSKGSVSISGDLGEAGGLVGWLVASSLYWTYSQSRVSGGSQSGGLAGDLVGVKHISVSHSYSLGAGSPDDPLFDAFSVSESSRLFWDTQISGLNTSSVTGATGLSTGDMQVACEGEATGICALSDGFSFASGHYPRLKKCNSCDPGSPVFSDELLDGQSPE